MEGLQRIHEQLETTGQFFGVSLFSGARVHDIDQIQGVYDFPHPKGLKTIVSGMTA